MGTVAGTAMRKPGAPRLISQDKEWYAWLSRVVPASCLTPPSEPCGLALNLRPELFLLVPCERSNVS